MVDLDADRRADRQQDAGHLELAEIGLVAEDVPAMVRFYDDFFGAGLRPAPLGGATLYRGRLHGVAFYLCPNEIAGVEARQNRHQFSYASTDLEAAVAHAERAGGTLKERGDGVATVLDPDGNNIVLTQR